MRAAGFLAAVVVSGGLVAVPHASGAGDAPETRSAATWSGQGRSFTSTERLDGTFGNPVTQSDVPDVSTLRVSAADAGEERDVYYMISTTMELSPGAPILKSYDLVNWEIVSYVYGILETTDSNALRNGKSAYGQGQWASTLNFHDGTYYVIFNSNNNGHSYLYSTDDIEHGTWEKHAYDRSFHDPSLFFDDAHGGTPYVFYGAASTSVARLSADLTTVEQTYPDIIDTENFVNATSYARSDFGGGWEGIQVYYANGYYYALGISWGKFGRQALVFRSKSLLGDAVGDPYAARIAIGTDAIAQGGFVSTAAPGLPPNYAVVFRDDYPTGRIPVVVPVGWDATDPDEWPSFGNGTVGPGQVGLPGALAMPVLLGAEERRRAMSASVVASDDFANDAEHREFAGAEAPATRRSARRASVEVGTDIVTNGDFEGQTLDGWESREGATLTTTTDAGHGSFAASATGRTSTGSGLHQTLAVDAGSTYDISFMVKYDEPTAAATVPFIASVDHGSDQGGSRWVNLANGTATKGEWSTITGTFTAPTNRSLDHFQVYIENPWSPTPTPANRPDYKIDDVRVVKTADATPLEEHDPAEDAYQGSDLALPWQWGHNPDNRFWSLTDRAGWLRLTNGHLVTGNATAQFRLTRFEEARNTLSQRTFGPTASAETRMDVSGLKDGDTAGLAVYNRQLSYVAARRVDGVTKLGVVSRPATSYADTNPSIAGAEDFLTSIDLPSGTDVVSVKADLDLRQTGATKNTVQFLYSLDGTTWQNLGTANPKLAGWEASHFKGQRFGLFSYATEELGGQVDFDHYYLSDTLSSQGLGVDRADLDWLVDEAEGLTAGDYTAVSWARVTKALAAADQLTAPSTQNQVDAPAQELNAAIAGLVEVDQPDPEPSATAVVASASSVAYGRAGSLGVRVTGATAGVVSTVVGGRTVSAPVSAAGRATLPLAARTLAPGGHALTVSYAGTTAHRPSSATVRVVVTRAVARVTAASAAKARAGRALAVRVRVGADGVTPTGRVTVAVAGGRSVTRALRNGAVTVKVRVPARSAGRRLKVAVTYGGSTYVSGGRTTRSVKLTR